MSERVRTELFPGIQITLDLNDLTQRTTYWQGPRFEKPTPDTLANWGKKGAHVFFDVGANYGFYSYWMLTQCPDLLVHAFEPNKKNYDLISTVKADNHLGRLTVHATGLSNCAGQLSLRLHPGDSGRSMLRPTLCDRHRLGIIG